MANTYTQLHIQLVFAVKYRAALIQKRWQNDLHAYITGIVQNHGHKMLAINSMPDHIHILFGYRPTQLVPELVEQIKTSSNKYINNNGLLNSHFAWQGGYGAFSYSKSHVPAVIKYIQNQETHHVNKSFKMEYFEFLEKFDVEYHDQYLFDFFEDVTDWK